MAEGSNSGGAGSGGGNPSPLSRKTYLARSFYRGARMFDVFGASQGQDTAIHAIESDEAFTAYRKFVRGQQLVEGRK